MNRAGFPSPAPRRAAAVVFLCVLAAALAFAVPPASASTKLRQQPPELCFGCHPDLKENLKDPSVHFPFKQGMCLSCHAVHAGDKKALVKGEITALCLSCHNDMKARLEKGGVHSALLQGTCTDCHFPHSGKHKKLLVSEEKDLCWNCHGGVKEQLANPVVHAPFAAGSCASCHDPHASSEENQLVAKPNALCQRCHEPGCNVNGVSITHITKKLNCTQCHTGHNGKVAGLFGPKGHAPFMAKSCQSCHNPIEPGKPVTTWAQGQKLCFSCHEKDPTNFRDDDIHLMVAQNPCTLCHDYHASMRDTLTKKESSVCFTCHDTIEKKIGIMKKSLKKVHKERECFDCHKPMHSSQPHYFKTDVITLCSKCHAGQHRITHPLGQGVVDPRNGQVLTCISCHSLHDARADYMLQYDRKRQLCIQCHKED
jgi:predicted CXXCH cytochrome family protein